MIESAKSASGLPNEILPKGQFPKAEARAIVKDLFQPDPRIYWVDFLFFVTLGWISFVVTLQFPLFSVPQIFFFVVTFLAMYRSVLFIHELAHLKKNTFRRFRIVWNVVCGFPLMTPSITYHGVHNQHHMIKKYGTTEDAEYTSFAVQKPIKIVLYLSTAFFIPILFAFRWIIMTPLSYFNKNLSRVLWERGSSLSVNYVRPAPTPKDDQAWRLQQFGTCLYGWTAIGLVIAGVLSYQIFILWYAMGVMVFLLNSIRTLAAHAYRNPGDQLMTIEEQFLDSVDIPGNFFVTTLWAPVGLRYHATHHLFCNIPYHNLGKAYHRLLRELPDNSLYLQSTRKSLLSTLLQLWKESSTASKKA